MYVLSCPECPFRAPLPHFGPSLSGECECPRCGCRFEFHPEDEEDEEG